MNNAINVLVVVSNKATILRIPIMRILTDARHMPYDYVTYFDGSNYSII